MTKLTIGTRGSALALWQAHHVRARLLAGDPERFTVELHVIKTKGDKILDAPLAKVGGKGLFVKEIEEALLAGEVDLAVHSMKDVPAELLPGLSLCAISAREDAHDVLCTRDGRGLAALPEGAHVGTSSLRRVCQLRAHRPDLRTSPLRGNVNTRLGKLDAGGYDAIVLAAAGLIRLGRGDRISERLDPAICLPAVGQGVLALEARAGDERTRARARTAMHDEATAACAGAERAFLARLGGGCQTPLAAHARLDGDLVIEGLVGDLDGTILRRRLRGPREEAVELGARLAEALLADGAGDILARCEAEGLVGGA